MHRASSSICNKSVQKDKVLYPQKGVYYLNLVPHGHQNKDKMVNSSPTSSLAGFGLQEPGRHRQ